MAIRNSQDLFVIYSAIKVRRMVRSMDWKWKSVGSDGREIEKFLHDCRGTAYCHSVITDSANVRML